MKHDWEYKKLGEVCDFERGLTYSKNDESSSPTANIVFRSNNVDLETKRIVLDDLKYLVSDYKIPESKMVKFQTILMCMSNGSMQHVGKVAYIDKKYDAAFGGFMGLIIPKSNCYPKYLFYFLNSPTYRRFLLSVANGINITNLKFSDLRNLNLPVPALAVQEQIVAELDKVSEIIEKKQQQLKELDSLAQSIFYDMFGDPVENEKGWEVKKWEDLFDTRLGKMLDAKHQIASDASHYYLGNSNVQWGYFDLKSLNTMTFSKNEEQKFELKYGDLLVCEGGESGRCAVWLENCSEIKYQKAIHRARCKDDSVLPIFVRYFMQFLKIGGGLKDYISKSTIEHLTGEKLNKVPIILPPLALQQAFAEKVEAIERQKELITASIKEAQTLFDSRMDYWFGEN